MVQRSIVKRLGYCWMRILFRLVGVTLYGIRFRGRERLPPTGPVLVCANHQSYFDPFIVGMIFKRRLNYLARKSLFRFALFRWLLEFLDAISLERDGLGIAGIKECLRRIKHGEVVLIFPEGTRTRDGDVGSLQPGFVMLARRGGVTVLPVGIDGAYDAWPRNSPLPRLSPVRVCVGEPLTAKDIQELDDAQFIAELECRIRACFATARADRMRA